MKKAIHFGFSVLFGGAVGMGVAFAAGEPVISGIYGYFGGAPIYRVSLSANSGLIVTACPANQTLTGLKMANGGHAITCQNK
jgi:hypothetical protein